jgi:hypothetical protein
MAGSVLIFLIGVIWLMVPPILVALSIRDLRKSSSAPFWQKVMSVAVAVAVIVDWTSFLIMFAKGLIGGFGTHNMTTFMVNWFVVGSLVLLGFAIATKVARGKLVLATFLVFALWVGSGIVA